MSDLRLALSAGNVEYRPEPKMARSLRVSRSAAVRPDRFHWGGDALGENQPIRHPFFAGQPITSAAVNLSRRMRRDDGNQGMIGYTAVLRHFAHVFPISRRSRGPH